MEDVIIFLDGAYLSLISKSFGGGKPIIYDIRKFAERLAQKENLLCKRIYYYVSPPFQSESPSEEEIKRKQGYDKFVRKLREIGLIVREGRCQKINNTFSQKGVDTLITLDMIRNANLFKKFIIVTCDTDFVPAIIDVREKDKVEVIVYYFKDFIKGSKFSMSDHILDVCNKRVLLKKDYFYNLPVD